MSEDENDRKITWRFRLWWLRHRRHPWMRIPYGDTFCAKCKIVAPFPCKEDS